MAKDSTKRRLKEVRRVLEKVRTKGLDSTQLAPVEVAALMLFIEEILGSAPGLGTSKRISEAMAAVHERSISAAAPAFPELACRKGCSHCCRTFVSAAPVQIFAIADYIRNRRSEPAFQQARLTTAEEATRGFTVDTRDGAGIACPFLVESTCSIYPIRPPACRAHMSVSLDACKTAEFTKDGPNIPMPFFAPQLRTAVDQALWGVMYKRGLQSRGYELGEAVLKVLPDPMAEARWFAGDDVFADVAVDTSGMGSMSPAMAASIWDSLWDVAQGVPPPAGAPLNHLLPKWCF